MGIRMNLLMALSVCFASFASSWYDQKLEGWYYFEEAQETEEKTQVNTDYAEEILEGEKKKLKKLLSIALLIPTLKNVETYMQEQRRWVEQSAKFADAWGKILLEKPFLGDFLQNPTTSYGILAKREADLNQRKALLQSLSKTHFLLFFFKGGDPLSEKAAEVALLFSEINGWQLKAVSLNGTGLKNFMEHEIDKGISDNLGVQASPSFYAICPAKNTVYPVGAGLLSVSDIEQNIETQLNEQGLFQHE